MRKLNTKVGKITHYYDKIGVAIIKVEKSIKVGDKIKISGHDQEFTQDIDSLQLEHTPVKSAKKGVSVGLKVIKPVKENDQVYKAD